ncbi:MAG: GerW family sporulation protein [Christensenellaceae bacterium]
MNRKKFGFALYAYKVLKLIGGYVTTYPGGIALHISPKKAILKPYSGMDSERKKFSFTRTFRIVSFSLTTETGAEYLIPVSLAHTALRTVFFAAGGQRGKVENNLWLTDGDELRVSMNLVVFNLFILLCALLKFLKEKIKFMAEKNKKINNLIDSSVVTLNQLADVDTVVGKPIITASGFQVIPFSKVTMGCLSGGGEYGDVKVVKETDSMPFAGGSGSVVSMKPMGFIIDDGKTCRMIRITDQPMDNLIEKASEIVQNITAKN